MCEIELDRASLRRQHEPRQERRLTPGQSMRVPAGTDVRDLARRLPPIGGLDAEASRGAWTQLLSETNLHRLDGTATRRSVFLDIPSLDQAVDSLHWSDGVECRSRATSSGSTAARLSPRPVALDRYAGRFELPVSPNVTMELPIGEGTGIRPVEPRLNRMDTSPSNRTFRPLGIEEGRMPPSLFEVRWSLGSRIQDAVQELLPRSLRRGALEPRLTEFCRQSRRTAHLHEADSQTFSTASADVTIRITPRVIDYRHVRTNDRGFEVDETRGLSSASQTSASREQMEGRERSASVGAGYRGVEVSATDVHRRAESHRGESRATDSASLQTEHQLRYRSGEVFSADVAFDIEIDIHDRRRIIRPRRRLEATVDPVSIRFQIPREDCIGQRLTPNRSHP